MQQEMMKWFGNFKEDPITNKIQGSNIPRWKLVFSYTNNNGSNTNMMVGILFNNTPTFIYGGWEGYYSINKHVIVSLR